MTHLAKRKNAYLALLWTASAVLSGCGGGTDSATDSADFEAHTAAADSAPSPKQSVTEPPNTNAAQKSAGKAATNLATKRSSKLAANATSSTAPILTIRARGTLAANVGPVMEVRINGTSIGSVEVKSTSFADYSFTATQLTAGAKVEVVFNNDLATNGQDRNLYVAQLQDSSSVVLPIAPGNVYDRGAGSLAFDNLDTRAGQGEMTWAGALRIKWPTSIATNASTAAKDQASRFLQQATFGPTVAEIDRLAASTPAAWLTEQMAIPFKPDFVNFIQAKYAKGAEYRPLGKYYNPSWVTQQFWATSVNAPDQLRKRVAHALHEVFVISQIDSNLYIHTRAYANYLDLLNKHAFGNYRDLLEEMALAPAMGIYLSHIHNRKEDSNGNLPDENFAREVMQLFSIGLYELNPDGTNRNDANGKPVETYTNADVMALAKVFTGWSWAYPTSQMNDTNYSTNNLDYTVANDQGIDLIKMKPYPGKSSTVEKRLFSGKASAVVIPAEASATDNVRIALNALFNHPNVGPFLGRQLIQRLVTSNPSPAYVARVASAFNNNGSGVRGDLSAVIRAILLDAEARSAPTAGFGKLREPVLRIAHWMRAFGATSVSGEFMMAAEGDTLSERPMYAQSVFSYYRPGYVPPNTTLSANGETAPEFQILNESTSATWVNLAEQMTGVGVGWNGMTRDVLGHYETQAALGAANVQDLLTNINILMFGGQMSAELRQAILTAVLGVTSTSSSSHVSRARIAVFLALASPEYLIQR